MSKAVIDLAELQRLAEGASDSAGDWFCSGLLEPGAPDISASMEARRFMSAMSPDTAKKLIAVVRAAQKADGSWASDKGIFDAMDALRAALEELK